MNRKYARPFSLLRIFFADNYCPFPSDKPRIPAVDLAVAISSTALNSNKNFQLMKDIVKSIIDKYGSSKIKYGMIIFGPTARINLKFSESFSTNNELKKFINALPRVDGNSKVLFLELYFRARRNIGTSCTYLFSVGT